MFRQLRSKPPASTAAAGGDGEEGIFLRFRDGCRDYRLNYPNARNIDNENLNRNVDFYLHGAKDRPNAVTLSEYHKDWFGDYDNLELSHSFIQWLFPIHEEGVNSQAQVLQRHEARQIRESEEGRRRILDSYRLMLDFYGLVLDDETTGYVRRAKHYKSRFQHLNRSFHNYLRITRILKCLGEMGFEHLKKPLILAFFDEVYVDKTLPNMQSSFEDYFISTLRNNDERKEVMIMVEDFKKGKAKKKAAAAAAAATASVTTTTSKTISLVEKGEEGGGGGAAAASVVSTTKVTVEETVVTSADADGSIDRVMSASTVDLNEEREQQENDEDTQPIDNNGSATLDNNDLPVEEKSIDLEELDGEIAKKAKIEP